MWIYLKWKKNKLFNFNYILKFIYIYILEFKKILLWNQGLVNLDFDNNETRFKFNVLS